MHGEELQVDRAPMPVIMANARDQGADGSLYAELFVEFTRQSLFRALAGLNLAAGKFPLERHGLIGASLADKKFATSHNQCGRNKAERWTGRAWIGVRLSFFHDSSVNAPKG